MIGRVQFSIEVSRMMCTVQESLFFISFPPFYTSGVWHLQYALKGFQNKITLIQKSRYLNNALTFELMCTCHSNIQRLRQGMFPVWKEPNGFLGFCTEKARMLLNNDNNSQVSCAVSPNTFIYHNKILVTYKDSKFKQQYIMKKTIHYLILMLN